MATNKELSTDEALAAKAVSDEKNAADAAEFKKLEEEVAAEAVTKAEADKLAAEEAGKGEVSEALAAQAKAEAKNLAAIFRATAALKAIAEADLEVHIHPDTYAETVKVTALAMDLRDPYVEADVEESRWLRVGVQREVKLTNWLKGQIDAGYAQVNE